MTNKKEVATLTLIMTKITQLEIGSKWKHKTSNDVYVVVE